MLGELISIEGHNHIICSDRISLYSSTRVHHRVIPLSHVTKEHPGSFHIIV